MTSSLIDIESQALRLAPEERVRLADRLLASLSPDAALEAEWAEEATRRLAEIESGAVAAVPVEDAIARVRSAIR
ncbi:MAG: addiction module protein [Pseudomonadota bacterium]